MKHPVTLRGLLVVAVALPLSRSTAAAQRITVSPPVHLGGSLATEPQFEMILNAHPTNASMLVACTMMFTRARRHNETVTYVSADRGKTWNQVLRVTSPKEQEAWDPTCAFGPDGSLWSGTEVIDTTGLAYVRFDRSVDGGKSWLTPRYVPHFERAFLTFDHNRGPGLGRIFVHGNGGMTGTSKSQPRTPAMGIHILDSAARALRTELVPSGAADYSVITGPGVVLSDGTFVGAFGEFIGMYAPDGSSRTPRYDAPANDAGRPNAAVKVLRSEGDRFVTSTVADEFMTWPGWSLGPIAYLAADTTHGPFRDRVYVTWADERSGRSQPYLSHSDDAGRSWSAPRVVNDDRAWSNGKGPNDFHAAVAVNGAGVLGIVWNDRRNSPNNLSFGVRFAASYDGGETFTPSLEVEKRGSVPGSAARWQLRAIGGDGAGETLIGMHSFNFSGGHTRGFTADAAGDFHAMWMSDRTGVPQLWTARITAPGRGARNGGGALATFSDITDRAVASFENVRLDRRSNTIAADLRVTNVGMSTIRGRVVVRVLELRSAQGEVTMARADNGLHGAGATIDLTSMVGAAGLAPGASTRARSLTFTLSRASTDSDALGSATDVLSIRTAVLARPR